MEVNSTTTVVSDEEEDEICPLIYLLEFGEGDRSWDPEPEWTSHIRRLKYTKAGFYGAFGEQEM